jgi:hypothetical protein
VNQPVRVDRELLLEFFLVFARAEFALKNSGFVTGGEDSALPHWDRFATAIKDQFRKDKTRELEAAVDYIMLNPPMKQVLRGGNLMWEANLPNNGMSETQVLFVLVRRIRNNLFHGGKHNFDVFEDTGRTTQLLRSALVIVQESLSVLPNVKATYDQAAI